MRIHALFVCYGASIESRVLYGFAQGFITRLHCPPHSPPPSKNVTTYLLLLLRRVPFPFYCLYLKFSYITGLGTTFAFPQTVVSAQLTSLAGMGWVVNETLSLRIDGRSQ